MLELTDYKSFPASMKGLVLAIGNFDGVHLGHRAVLQHALDLALKRELNSGVMFFAPHPRQYFSPDTPLFMLTSRAQKLAQFRGLGLEVSLQLKFDADLAQMEAEDFVKTILVDALGVSHVVIGYDFFFGRARGGNPQVMSELGEKFGFGVSVMKAEGLSGSAEAKQPDAGGLIYSSTLVRDALEEGQVKRAALILGRNWQVEGVVTSGAGRGEGLGFPTANITMPPGCHLHHGIYAGFVHFEGARYKAAAYYGKRPSFDNDQPVLEVFLLDYQGNLYDKEIAVEFVDFIREDMKFSNSAELVAQMDIDCKQVEDVLRGQ